MKRTQPHVVGSPSLQMHEIADDIHDVGSVQYALYGFFFYDFHKTKIVKKNKTASRLPYFFACCLLNIYSVFFIGKLRMKKYSVIFLLFFFRV